MPSTYLALNVHIVFATQGRHPTIVSDWRAELHAYIGGIVRGLGAVPLAIGGVADHVHLLLGLRGTHAVGEIVREIKKSSNAWVKDRHPGFAWQEGYGAFTVSPEYVDRVRTYISNQEEHHATVSSEDELRYLLADLGIKYDERYFL